MCRTKDCAHDPALGACAAAPGRAVNMLTDENRCKRHPAAIAVWELLDTRAEANGAQMPHMQRDVVAIREHVDAARDLFRAIDTC